MSAPAAAPLISIALCTYNGERYLGQQLDSLLAQTYPNFEIVAVDDTSADGSYGILCDYARRDPRLRCYRNERNLGFRKNFEVALGYCGGGIIALSDQDDIWRPDKLAVLAEAMIREQAVMAHSNSEMMDADGNNLGPRVSPSVDMQRYQDPASYVYNMDNAGHASLYRREVIEAGMPLPPELYHDWWLAFVAASIGKVVYIDESLVRYRRHWGSVMYQIEQAPEDRQAGFRSRQLQEVETRLAAFATLAGPHQAFFQRLLQLWRRRNDALFSPGLAFFMFRHRRRLFPHDRPSRQIRQPLKYLWGLRLKRWLEPARYAQRQAG